LDRLPGWAVECFDQAKVSLVAAIGIHYPQVKTWNGTGYDGDPGVIR